MIVITVQIDLCLLLVNPRISKLQILWGVLIADSHLIRGRRRCLQVDFSLLFRA